MSMIALTRPQSSPLRRRAIAPNAPRPLELTFDGSAYAGLRPDEIVKKAAEAQGMETATLKIEKTAANQGLSCGMQTRVGDVVEIEYEASYSTATGRTVEFDSSAQRSGWGAWCFLCTAATAWPAYRSQMPLVYSTCG